MYNSNIPQNQELPTTRKLIKSTIIAFISAIVLLITVVMPAEYGIDPTGIGKTLGLQKMGEIRVSLAQEAEADRLAEEAYVNNILKEQAEFAGHKSDSLNKSKINSNDQIEITLAPNQGAEVKLDMIKDATAKYSWTSKGGKVNFDTHGDSKKLNIKYHNYSKGLNIEGKSGNIKAAFDGSHGWFWRNRTDNNVTIILNTQGQYSKLYRVK